MWDWGLGRARRYSLASSLSPSPAVGGRLSLLCQWNGGNDHVWKSGATNPTLIYSDIEFTKPRFHIRRIKLVSYKHNPSRANHNNRYFYNDIPYYSNNRAMCEVVQNFLLWKRVDKHAKKIALLDK